MSSSVTTHIDSASAPAILEHANVTVSDPNKTADLLCRLLDWKIRWQGEAIDGGYTVHVGSDHSYVALYTQSGVRTASASSYTSVAGLNHLGFVVPDLAEMERRVRAEGLTPTSFGDYEPGKRFYTTDGDGIEFEFVSYA